ncbi:MAG: DUF4221 family protein [Bacteroidia bacterium]|nr:DUF4221 family protein [Bacteroidia bacterium]
MRIRAQFHHFSLLLGILLAGFCFSELTGCKSDPGAKPFQLTEADQISFNSPQAAGIKMPYWAGKVEKEGEPWLAFTFLDSSFIHFQSLVNKDSAFQISLKKDNIFPMTLDDRGDTLFVFSLAHKNFHEQIHAVSWKGEKIRTISTLGFFNNPDPDNSFIESELEFLDAGPFTPLIYFDQKLFFGMIPFLPLNQNPDKKRTISAAWDLTKGEILRFPIYHPEAYYKSETTVDYLSVFQILSEGKLVVSFAASPEIIVFDLEKNELKEYAVTSENLSLNSPPPPLDSDRAGEILIRNGFWGPIIYDPHAENYYRVIYKAEDLDSYPLGQQPGLEERKNFLIAMDKDFQKLGEFEIPSGLDFNVAWCDQVGLHIFDPALSRDKNEYIFRTFALQGQENG